ncbi:hypothetical protein [Paenibacillus sp. YN15]|uniref:hypothetical protein n=1 Tax=Paenibacillus sp. YN15 TaxID=1742774 RepID=UPI0015ECAF01|nr:hypothetical protein [Paenibacillus sp. YN15]
MKKPTYEELFKTFSAAVERRLLHIAAVLAVLLVVAQLLLQIPAVRHALLRVERLEGTPFPVQEGKKP